jgi:hypothetical protein
MSRSRASLGRLSRPSKLHKSRSFGWKVFLPFWPVVVAVVVASAPAFVVSGDHQGRAASEPLALAPPLSKQTHARRASIAAAVGFCVVRQRAGRLARRSSNSKLNDFQRPLVCRTLARQPPLARARAPAPSSLEFRLIGFDANCIKPHTHTSGRQPPDMYLQWAVRAAAPARPNERNATGNGQVFEECDPASLFAGCSAGRS